MLKKCKKGEKPKLQKGFITATHVVRWSAAGENSALNVAAEPVFERYGGSASALRSEGSTRQGRFSVCAGLHSVCGLRLAHSNLSYEATCQVTETDSSTLVVKSGSSIFIAARTAASLRPKVTHAFQHRRMVFDLLPHGMQGTIHQVHVLVELFEPLLQLTKAPVGGTDPGLEFRMLRFPHQPEPLGHLFLRLVVRRPEQRRMLQEIVGRSSCRELFSF
eukprot:CAMPEP_0194488630 /NCGR_PEP_ID=MMETSP0253-20130528/8479_1 /TAXON_ID=2966 /ORGANISM="Noctiluca scintillans" /LENGTH=218 /DNA_ID=CAMNT_0039329021 /DNA_START=951 /DNA_END=1608 /DNA_ORIENTATION=-